MACRWRVAVGQIQTFVQAGGSRTLTNTAWLPARVSDGIAEEIATMKAQPRKDIVLFAGAGIATTFMNLDLVDEYRLMVHPIVLSKGLSLFKDVAADRRLKLSRAETFSSGVVLLQYERDRNV